MIKTTLLSMAVLAMAVPSSAVTTTKKSTVKHHATAARSAATSSRTASTKRKGSKPVARTPVRRNFQQSPTPDRYKEIQTALASKGYYRGEPNGEWGADSQEALKKFQAEQNLTADGKLNSMSLIALGLGPKRLSAQQTHAQPAAPAPEVQK